MLANSETLLKKLQDCASLPDENLEVGRMALWMAALDHPGISLDRYAHHLKMLAEDTAARFTDILKAGEKDNAGARLSALKQVIVHENGYERDEDTASHTQEADLIRVIDRRKGQSEALSILYIHAASEQGWPVDILKFPGRFLLRMDCKGIRLIFDPLDNGRVMDAPDLRRLVKDAFGSQAELLSSYYEAAGNRELLLALGNRIKHSRIEAEDYAGALVMVERMRAFAPDDYRLMLDEGVLCSRTEQPQRAMDALEAYIDKAPDPADRREAALLLEEIRHSKTL